MTGTPKYEIFPHDDKFIIVKHYIGQDAGFATPVVPKGYPGRPGRMDHATAYKVARRFQSEAQARGWLGMHQPQDAERLDDQ